MKYAMTRLTLTILAITAVTVIARQPPVWLPDGPEELIPEVERRIPPGDYCKRSDVEIRPTETHAHHCDCEYSCTLSEDGTIVEHETSTCQAWCQKNGRRCTCWPEGDPSKACTAPGSHAVDMDGVLIR